MKVLTELESEEFLKKEKLPVVQKEIVETEHELSEAIKIIKFPLVLKITGVPHKTDVKGVRFINKEEELIKNFRELQKIKPGKIIVQKFIPGYSILIGLKKDPVFEHVIACGLGGIYTEILKDISFKICPITKSDALDMLQKLKSYQILKGARNYEPANIQKLIEILVKVSKLSQKYKNIEELDINPVIINKDTAQIVDALISFKETS